MAIVDAHAAYGQPDGLTLVFGAPKGNGRSHGLNLLAHEGLVRRFVGGQWHPVPRLQALASANLIEGYSLPVGIINWLFRDIAEGLTAHVSRSGLGTFTDPRNGGGRLNPRTREQLVRLVRPVGDEALLFRGMPIDAAFIGVAIMEGSAEIAMTREAMTIARAARRSGGVVIAQLDRIGTLERLPPGQVVVPEMLVDVLVAAEARVRGWETFTPSVAERGSQRLLTH